MLEIRSDNLPKSNRHTSSSFTLWWSKMAKPFSVVNGEHHSQMTSGVLFPKFSGIILTKERSDLTRLAIILYGNA